MSEPAHSSYSQWYSEGHLGSYVRTLKSSGGVLDLLEATPPAGDNSGPAVPDLVLCQDMLGGSRVIGNLGGRHFDVVSEKGGLFLAAPNFARKNIVDKSHRIRAVAFPVAQWQQMLDEAANGPFSLDLALWTLCDEEGAPSRLLARAAGCEILAELCRIGGAPLAPAKGGLAPWAERRVIELLHARLAEDVGLDELAAEAQLSAFHFARMFKQSVGVPPRVYLTQLRIEKACDLLKETDAPITQIALEVGYSSNQVLARVFLKYRHMSPTDYRRAVRD